MFGRGAQPSADASQLCLKFGLWCPPLPARWDAPEACMQHARTIWATVSSSAPSNTTNPPKPSATPWARILAQWDAQEAAPETVAVWGSEHYRRAAERGSGSGGGGGAAGLPSGESLCSRLSGSELSAWFLSPEAQREGRGTRMRRGLSGWHGALEHTFPASQPSHCHSPRGRACVASAEEESVPLALLNDSRPAPLCLGTCRREEGWSVYVGDLREDWAGSAATAQVYNTTENALRHVRALLAALPGGRAASPACPLLRRSLGGRGEEGEGAPPCLVLAAAAKNHHFAAMLARNGRPMRNTAVLSLADEACVAMCSSTAQRCTGGRYAHRHSSWLALAPPAPEGAAAAGRARAAHPAVRDTASGQQAAILSSHADPSRSYRVGLDVSMPLPVLNALSTPRPPDAPPALLLSFIGTVYMEGRGAVRRELARLHNGRDVVVSMDWFHLEQNSSHAQVFHRMALGAPASRFRDFMELSWFCLAPAGRSPMSFRLLEALHAGCLPVFLGDPDTAWVPPLVEFVPWEEFLVYACVPTLPREWQDWWQVIRALHDAPDCPTVPERDIGRWPSQRVPIWQLPRVLRAIPVHERLRRRELMLRFYYRYLRTHATALQYRRDAEVTRPVLLALRILHDRIHPHKWT